MKSTLLSLNHEASFEQLSLSRQSLEKVLLTQSISKKLRNNILLAFSEVVTNSIEHGQAKNYEMSFEYHSAEWVLVVKDNGNPYNPIKEEFDLEQIYDFEENMSGRGLFLIQQLCSRVAYEFDEVEQLNLICFKWGVEARDRAPQVLLVDDDPMVLKVAQIYCEDSEYELTTMNQAESALELLQKRVFDVIISDIKMPDMDGLKLREIVMTLESYATVPFLFLSGVDDNISGDQVLIERAIHLNIDGIIKKPATKPDFLNNISRTLSRAKFLKSAHTNYLDQAITQTFLPNLPSRINDWQISFATRSTGQGGGDVALLKQSKQGASLYLADLMGHNQQSKFFVFAMMGYLEGLLGTDADRSICEVVSLINQCAYSQALLNKTTLTFLGLSLHENGQLRMVNAGHPEPLLISEKSVEGVYVNGILPGLVEDYEFEMKEISLRKNQRLAVFTDGLFESASTKESRQLLEMKLIQKLQDTIGLPVEDALRIVMTEFDLITHYKALDDVLLILIDP
jgi:sigma-B regulation protein RsbU (phosphoserine phosphatase)